MEEEHSQEINKLHLEASKNEIVPFKDSKNDDYQSLRGEDKVSNCFPLSHLAFQMLEIPSNFVLGVFCAASKVQFC